MTDEQEPHVKVRFSRQAMDAITGVIPQESAVLLTGAMRDILQDPGRETETRKKARGLISDEDSEALRHLVGTKILATYSIDGPVPGSDKPAHAHVYVIIGDRFLFLDYAKAESLEELRIPRDSGEDARVQAESLGLTFIGLEQQDQGLALGVRKGDVQASIVARGYVLFRTPRIESQGGE